MNVWQYSAIGLIGLGLVFVVVGVVRLTGSDPQDQAAGAATTTTGEPAPETTGPPTTLDPATQTSPPASSTTATPATTSASTTTTSTTTTSTTTTPTSTTTVPSETPEEFLERFVAGLRGDVDFLIARLNRATIEIYGESQCRENFAALADPEADLELREVGELEPWDYTVDGIVTRIPDALPVEVERFLSGQTIIQEIHWQLVAGSWTWFTDCGDPLAG